MGVQGVDLNYMQAVVKHAQQAQSRVILDLMNVQKTAVEVHATPMRPIGPSGNMVDAYA